MKYIKHLSSVFFLCIAMVISIVCVPKAVANGSCTNCVTIISKPYEIPALASAMALCLISMALAGDVLKDEF